MKMTENDIIAAYVRSRYPNLIKTVDYNTYAAAKRINAAFEAIKVMFKIEPREDVDVVDLIRRVNNNIEREQKYGRDEEGAPDRSTETPGDIRAEEAVCGEPVSDTEQGSDLQED
jgi:hypothetical protein